MNFEILVSALAFGSAWPSVFNVQEVWLNLSTESN